MSNNIYLSLTDDAEPPQWFDIKKTQNFLNTLLKTCSYDNWELSVLFCSNDFIQNLNKQYRNLNEPTDVLSFSQIETNNEDFAKAKSELPFVAGDIVLSFETLGKNAKVFNVPEKEEFLRLLIHGVLHLSGYDHQTNETSEPMLQLQEKLLNEVANEYI
ncbi:MAG: rRNA maturation RNase YbeY [Treponemataceae bacterium]